MLGKNSKNEAVEHHQREHMGKHNAYVVRHLPFYGTPLSTKVILRCGAGIHMFIKVVPGEWRNLPSRGTVSPTEFMINMVGEESAT